jgi:hypothetical protein
MRIFATAVLLFSVAAAQTDAPAGKRVEWNPSRPEALKELPNGQTQKNAESDSIVVSAMMDVTSAKRFTDPPSDGGQAVTYIVIGVQNASQQSVRVDPGSITLRVVGKKEKALKRLSEDQVVERAWHAAERYIPTTGPGQGGMGSGGGEQGVEAAITHQDLSTGDKRMQQGPEQALAQAAKLKEKALANGEVAAGESVMGLLFFYPYDKKDKLELSVRVGETDFIFPFAGPKSKP